jgi:DNA polymerase sigma
MLAQAAAPVRSDLPSVASCCCLAAVRPQVERVLHARVPVIKFTHKETGLACDFSVNRPECTFKADMQK